MLNRIKVSVTDLSECFHRLSLVVLLGLQDVRQRYRRSKLGPFWITISMGVMIGMIGLIFGQVMNNPMHDYMPFLATGIIFWNFISTSVMEGATSFIDGQGMIRQLNLPLTMYPMRVIWRNIIILGHNLLILPIAMIVVGKGVTWNVFWVIPGFVVLTINVFWVSLFLSVLCTRFRDMPQIVSSLLQVMFYLTPVIWMPGALGEKTRMMLLDPNPAFHLLELVRAPVLGYLPSMINWGIGVGLAAFGLFISFLFFGQYRKRIAYWL